MNPDFFVSRVEDTAEICVRNSIPKFLGFLTAEEAASADAVLKKQNCRYMFYGGYNDAERRILACLPDWCDNPDFPITALTFKYRVCDKLTHRDFLGSLMALGITRESVGDILVGEGRSVVFVTSEVAKHITEQIAKIGRVGIEVVYGFSEPLPGQSTLKDFSSTVASLRLDCIISALIGISRSQAAEMIQSDMVCINSLCCDKSTHFVKSGDKITVRGKGKLIISNTSSHTKKDRVVLEYKKYI